MESSPATTSEATDSTQTRERQSPSLRHALDTDNLTSCKRCKQRKSKCDRRYPRCRRCEDARASCEYVIRRRPGFAASHRQALETRIGELEEELRSVRSASQSTQHVANAGTTERHGAPAISSTAVTSDPDASTLDDRVFQATYPRTASVAERPPPVDVVVSSISTYFRHIHPWLPFLDAQNILTGLSRMRQPSLLHHAMFGASIPFLYDSRLDQLSSDAFWKFTKRRINNETSEEPSYASLEAATILCLDLSGMTNGPQVWSRLAVISKLASQLRTQGGLVLRPRVQAEMDEHDRTVHISKPGSRQHARLFWAIYALDTYITITTSQAPCLSDRDTRCFLPTRSAVWDDEQPPKHQEASADQMPPEHLLFLLQLQLLDLAREAHGVYLDYLTMIEGTDSDLEGWVQSFSKVSQSVDAWLRNLPSRLGEPSDSVAGKGRDPAALPPTAVMLRIYGHALIVYLNGLARSCSYVPLENFRMHFGPDAHDKCLQSINAICGIASQVVHTMDDQLGWPFTWGLWTAARYCLAVALGESSNSSQQLQILTSCLLRMGKFWQISKKYWRLLRRAEMVLQAQNSTDRLDQSSIVWSIIDFRVPTSHIEDQFRVDPVLARGEDFKPAASGPAFAGPQALTSSHVGFPMADIGTEDIQIPDDRLMASDTSDFWFTAPLFASSAYHQFPDADSTPNESWYDSSWQP